MKIGIVGGGLSGCILAFQLLKEGQEVVLFDNAENHSSIVAAGMINPLVFRRMTKSWRLDEFMAYLIHFYTDLEKVTNSSFFHPITIRRFFSSMQEKNYWLKRQSTDEFSPYMEVVTDEDESYLPEATVFGSARVKQSFYIQTKVFISALHSFLTEKAVLRKEDFEYTDLDVSALKYKDEQFDKFIFCEGFKGKDNPWFSYLPLTQTKGETLTVELNSIPDNESLNRKCFVLPLGENQFKIGSTYIWDTADFSTTEEGKELILDNLKYLTTEVPKIIQQDAGIRPTTVDRRPLLGEHPEHKNLYVFNGLGAKGYMIAPLLASEMIDYLIHGVELSKEISINRCIK